MYAISVLPTLVCAAAIFETLCTFYFPVLTIFLIPEIASTSCSREKFSSFSTHCHNVLKNSPRSIKFPNTSASLGWNWFATMHCSCTALANSTLKDSISENKVVLRFKNLYWSHASGDKVVHATFMAPSQVLGTDLNRKYHGTHSFAVPGTSSPCFLPFCSFSGRICSSFPESLKSLVFFNCSRLLLFYEFWVWSSQYKCWPSKEMTSFQSEKGFYQTQWSGLYSILRIRRFSGPWLRDACTEVII